MPPVDHLRAPAKLTRSLRVVGVRDDGYHLLEAEMVTMDLADELEIEDGGDGLEVLDEVAWLLGDGALPAERRAPASVPPGPENLVARALVLVGRQARVRLRKRVPAGAGLGGGSADAAAVLRWAGVARSADRRRPGRRRAVLRRRRQGAGDAAIGELVEPLAHEAFTAVLVTPALAVSTLEVYRAWDDPRRSERASTGTTSSRPPWPSSRAWPGGGT